MKPLSLLRQAFLDPLPPGRRAGDSPARAGSPYRSFWMGGFEGADHVNGRGVALDMVQASGHADHLDGDYRRMAALGLRTVRESMGWRLCEPGGGVGGAHRFDFARVQRFAAAAGAHGLQIAWTLMHYGMPRDLDVFGPDFAKRFAEFAGAAARALAPLADDAPVYTPINEISFLSWAVSESDLLHGYRPLEGDGAAVLAARQRQGFAAKCRLVQAALGAMQAIRAEAPRARFLHVEPLIHVVAPREAPHLAEQARAEHDEQWQTWDLLGGRLLPELGGHEGALDLLGVNHYHNGQFETSTLRELSWEPRDSRRVGLASLLAQAHVRYRRPLLVAETSHVGVGRGRWLREIADEVEQARRDGTVVQGVCLYPVIDRPDWNDADHWHRSGLFDVVPGPPDATGAARPGLERRLVLPYARSLRRVQQQLRS